jgi:hypothetical protein
MLQTSQIELIFGVVTNLAGIFRGQNTVCTDNFAALGVAYDQMLAVRVINIVIYPGVRLGRLAPISPANTR